MSLIHLSNLFVSTNHNATQLNKKTTENKKDPGIPNNYPFKEQLLQQIADQKLKAAEEKERQKLARRAAQDKARQLKKGANKTNNTNTENKSAAKSKATDAAKSSEKAKAKAPAKGKKEFAATAAAVDVEESDEDGDAPYNFGEHFTATNGELYFQMYFCHVSRITVY